MRRSPVMEVVAGATAVLVVLLATVVLGALGGVVIVGMVAR